MEAVRAIDAEDAEGQRRREADEYRGGGKWDEGGDIVGGLVTMRSQGRQHRGGKGELIPLRTALEHENLDLLRLLFQRGQSMRAGGPTAWEVVDDMRMSPRGTKRWRFLQNCLDMLIEEGSELTWLSKLDETTSLDLSLLIGDSDLIWLLHLAGGPPEGSRALTLLLNELCATNFPSFGQVKGEARPLSRTCNASAPIDTAWDLLGRPGNPKGGKTQSAAELVDGDTGSLVIHAIIAGGAVIGKRPSVRDPVNLEEWGTATLEALTEHLQVEGASIVVEFEVDPTAASYQSALTTSMLRAIMALPAPVKKGKKEERPVNHHQVYHGSCTDIEVTASLIGHIVGARELYLEKTALRLLQEGIEFEKVSQKGHVSPLMQATIAGRLELAAAIAKECGDALHVPDLKEMMEIAVSRRKIKEETRYRPRWYRPWRLEAEMGSIEECIIEAVNGVTALRPDEVSDLLAFAVEDGLGAVAQVLGDTNPNPKPNLNPNLKPNSKHDWVGSGR